MPSPAELSPAGCTARRHDPDRFLCALFAPARHRETLFLLIAFNHELVHALQRGGGQGGGRAETGPLASLIRLQWWRDVIEGAAYRHDLASELAGAVAAGALDRETLLEIIAAREQQAEGIETLEQWRAVQLAGPGGVQRAAARALGERDPATLDRVAWLGAAYDAGISHRGAGASLRAQPASMKPVDQAPARLAAEARDWLQAAAGLRLGRARIACALPGVLARRDLECDPDDRPRGLGDRLALTAAWLRGRV